jgi:hypothetical protein
MIIGALGRSVVVIREPEKTDQPKVLREGLLAPPSDQPCRKMHAQTRENARRLRQMARNKEREALK